MTPGARIQAAIDILSTLEENPRAADRAVKDWCAAHRFAGSKDRAAIREMVFSAYRARGRAADLMQAETPRAIVLGGLKLGLGWSAAAIAESLEAGKYSAAPLEPDERARLEIAADVLPAEEEAIWPAWLTERMMAAHGARAEALMAALLEPAPLDLRVNMARADRASVIAALNAVGFEAEATPLSPWGVRVARGEGLTGANIRSLPLFRDGAVEIQDEGSQLTALLSGAASGMQVMELCAGGGGKTLALAMMMGRSGQIFACDNNTARLRAAKERIARADLHNVQTRLLEEWTPEGDAHDPDLEAHAGQMDLVFLDVPCSGSGAWRRQPDGKWRLQPRDLDYYIATQASILARGARLVKPGGRLVYVTCSVLMEENANQLAAFLARHDDYALKDGAALWQETMAASAPEGTLVAVADGKGAHALQLSPVATGTDGFFMGVMEKAG